MKEYLGIALREVSAPPLDPDFLPLSVWMEAYLAGAARPVTVAAEREGGRVVRLSAALRGEGFAAANGVFLERLVKCLLWSAGSWRIWLCGVTEEEAAALRAAYAPGGARQFDAATMERIYGRPLEVRRCEAAELPPARETALPLGGHTEGCRIGFDAGGSDRKVAAVQDGRVVYAAETVWHPKEAADPRYHYEGVVAALREAAARLPRVDAIGISSAGVIVAGEPRVSSLFLSVDGARQRETRSLYLRAARAIGDVPLAVANDGDVAALAGAMALGRGDVLGLAMGTSQAAGYVDGRFGLSGRLHELAFVPVDLSEAAPTDPWSGDRGVGAQYFSQEGVIRLARAAGLPLTDGKPPAEKLKEVQILAVEGHTGAERVFRSLGVYLAHALPLYDRLRPMGRVLLLGRVCSGAGGAWLLESCRAALERDHPALGARLCLHLPEERQRRVGQAVAAASLPATK